MIGAGNVATHLSRNFYSKGHNIVAIAARSKNSADKLARQVKAEPISSIREMPTDLDIVIISTTDSAISEVVKEIPDIKGIIAHTSGSISLDTIKDFKPRAAVLYPLQTFSKGTDVDISKVPFFLEASDETTLKTLKNIAQELSEHIYEADSTLRSRLHVAGVLSSNFPIYLLEMARKVLAEENLPLSLIKPLVEASIDKAFMSSPLEALTGPAKRGDTDIVKRQSESFSNSNYKDIYDSISKAILEEFKSKTS